MFQLNALFTGIVVALGALVLEVTLLIFDPSLQGTLILMTLSVFVEELAKFLVIQKIAITKKISSAIFLKAFLIGVGFSFTEIILNIFSHYNTREIFFWSYIGLFLIHTFTATLFGYYLAILKKESFLISSLVVLIAFLSHLFFNLAVLYNLNIFLVDIILFVFLLYLFLKNHSSKKTLLPD